jgi:hypothetical protein
MPKEALRSRNDALNPKPLVGRTVAFEGVQLAWQAECCHGLSGLLKLRVLNDWDAAGFSKQEGLTRFFSLDKGPAGRLRTSSTGYGSHVSSVDVWSSRGNSDCTYFRNGSVWQSRWGKEGKKTSGCALSLMITLLSVPSCVIAVFYFIVTKYSG